jgi:hypothetical protein
MNDSTNNRNPHWEFITSDNVVMLFIQSNNLCGERQSS